MVVLSISPPFVFLTLTLSLFFNTSRYPLERITMSGIIADSCLIHSRDASVTGSQMNAVLGWCAFSYELPLFCLNSQIAHWCSSILGASPLRLPGLLPFHPSTRPPPSTSPQWTAQIMVASEQNTIFNCHCKMLGKLNISLLQYTFMLEGSYSRAAWTDGSQLCTSLSRRCTLSCTEWVRVGSKNFQEPPFSRTLRSYCETRFLCWSSFSKGEHPPNTDSATWSSSSPFHVCFLPSPSIQTSIHTHVHGYMHTHTYPFSAMPANDQRNVLVGGCLK